MSETEFWSLIDKARYSVSTVAEMPEWLVDHLKNKPEAIISDFGRFFRQAIRRAYDERLWAAAYAISHHFASDDAFSDFQGWLIAQGREVYERALVDPDSLADLDRFDGEDGENARLERMLYVADMAYKLRTGGGDLGDFIGMLTPPALQNEGIWDGKPETLEKIVPRLYSKFECGN